MTIEQRLTEAMRQVDRYEPSPDLWTRVERTIAEDGLRRRRLYRSLILAASLVAVLVLAALLSVDGPPSERFVDWRVMEIIETALLVSLVLALGPAIRRFGGTFVGDVFRAGDGIDDLFLRLLDAAFYLVFFGYVLVTARFVEPGALDVGVLGTQLADAAQRVGGLLLMMGVLHALTLIVLPIVGLAYASTRSSRSGVSASRSIPPAVLALAVVLLAAVLVAVGVVLLGVADAGHGP